MKLKRTILTTVLALAGSLVAQKASAATGTSGDLILGFRFSDKSNANDLEIDLGQASNFTTTSILNLTYGANYYAGSNLGGLASSDLDAVFGTSGGQWNTLSQLVWGISGRVGTTGSNTQVWATATLGAQHAAASGTTLAGPGGRMTTLTNNFNTANSVVGLTSPQAAAFALSTTSQTEYTGALRASTTIDYAFFQNSTEKGVSSTGSTSLELYSYTNNAVQDLGTFTLSSNGQLTFTGSAAVPEPSTLTALAGGIGLLGFIRRRRVTVA